MTRTSEVIKLKARQEKKEKEAKASERNSEASDSDEERCCEDGSCDLHKEYMTVTEVLEFVYGKDWTYTKIFFATWLRWLLFYLQFTKMCSNKNKNKQKSLIIVLEP